jgi:hypothetical protein
VYPIKNNFLEKTNANPDLYGVHIKTLHLHGSLAGAVAGPLACFLVSGLAQRQPYRHTRTALNAWG